MKFGLEVQVIENIISVLEQHPKVDKAFVFGSRAKGNYRADSDIDIALTGQDISYKDITSISVKLDDLNIGLSVDLLNYHTIGEPALKEHIDRVGIEFYSRWKEYRFSDFVLINPTVSLKGDKEYSFVEMKDLQDGNKVCLPSALRKTSSGARFQERDTLFARITPCLENGKICQVRNLENGVGFGSTEFLVFRGKENVSDNEFVFYLSRWDEVRDFAENNFEGTSGRQRVPKNCFENLKLNLPPLQEQTAIASILSSLDDKIDLLHRQNKTLEQLAETLFRQWFVEEAEESWETKTISEIIEVRDGTHDSPKQTETGRYLITSKHLKSTGIDFSTAYKISESDFANVNKRSKVDKDDILFSMIGTLGLIHYVDKEPDFAIKNMGLFKSSQKPSFARFLYLLLISPEGKKFVYENADGSTQEYITLSSLRNFEFKYPGDIRIEEFDIEIKPIFQKIESNQTQIRTLTQTRDTLLPKLMSGEVRVEM